MSDSHFQCQDFKGAHSLKLVDTNVTVVVSPIETGFVGTHFWNHARAHEGERKLAAIYCHDVTECTFLTLTSRVPGDYPLIWSFHAPVGSLPGSTRTGTVSTPIESFYKRVAEESGRLEFKTDFDLVVAGVGASSIATDEIVAELSKNDGISSVRPLVHTVTGYFDELSVQDDSASGKCEEHTCYDMYFFPTRLYGEKKLLVTNGKGKNKGIVHTIKL